MTSVFLHLPIRGNRHDHATRKYSCSVNVQFRWIPLQVSAQWRDEAAGAPCISGTPVARNEKELAIDGNPSWPSPPHALPFTTIRSCVHRYARAHVDARKMNGATGGFALNPLSTSSPESRPEQISYVVSRVNFSNGKANFHVYLSLLRALNRGKLEFSSLKCHNVFQLSQIFPKSSEFSLRLRPRGK